MSAAEALRVAHAAGITVTVDGESLVLEANAEPPQLVLNVLARHKLALLALLRSGQEGWIAEDWKARFDERAGFLEHDGDLLRVEAERQAFDSCIVEWLNRNPNGWGWFSRRGIVLGGQLWHLCTEAGHHFCCSQHQASLGTPYDHDPR
jgi:hypothetical protein